MWRYMASRSSRSRSFGMVRSLSSAPKTLFDKIWESHVVDKQDDGTCLIYIDRHLVHEVTSPQAFEGLRTAGRRVRRLDCTLATADHNVPTTDRSKGIDNPESKLQVETLTSNCAEFGLEYFGMEDKRQGIVHIVGPEQGFTQPGMTIVCGDSHTATHGAFGALAFGIGTSEVEHVLATQTLVQKPAKNMRISVEGDLLPGVTSKDLVLAIIGVIGTAGGTGHVIEYAGDVLKGLSMESRMTICNMSIEAGARAGMIAPDEVTFEYLKGRPMAPKGENWEKAVEYWKTLPSDPGATYDSEVKLDASQVAPMVTWGTSPEDVVAVTGIVPDPEKEGDPNKAKAIERALTYMGLQPGVKVEDIEVDKVFIGSCTNGRIEDLRAVAEVAKGQSVAKNIKTAMIVPGSGLVKRQAEDEGLDKIFVDAGFEWREPGCSMCLAMNADRLEPGERCASTSNRNFEGRQGKGGRTHLVSPAMAAAAAVTGRLADVRKIGRRNFSTGRRGFHSTRPACFDAFVKLSGAVAPLDMRNVDTDMIIPKQFLKTIKRSGLGIHCFDELRYTDDGKENKDFILNKSVYKGAPILVAGDNFGCGSSREHAPWALLDMGFKCVISTSFADIFYNNCFKNGILPIKVTEEERQILLADAQNEKEITVDLEACKIVRSEGEDIPFDVEEFRRHCLLHGLDDIGLTLQKEKRIQAFEEQRAKKYPWL
ncbi:hypothetical protein AAMO2058_001149200 [Amorphochlora amoebiformis]|uniref:3-isopropylmalate dehydratase n=1 Tax=Amorphochlora amoebiformis TaxID=1561963 RepID=A0A7S0DHX6_9EUKA|mmetsp:Transcript_28544/g.45464  ORF Transcript_28544/g.45464 Transcript_28544/m.45464 type:complete len:708 (+) Transcript_28544:53-2176(+)